MTRRRAACAALAAFLMTAAPESLRAQVRHVVRPPESGSISRLPRDLRQVRLVTRTPSARRERVTPVGRHALPFHAARRAPWLLAPGIVVGVHVDPYDGELSQRDPSPPESKVIDVASVLRSFAAADGPFVATGDSAQATGEPARIENVVWLEGCWESTSQQRTVEERWTAPRAGSMLGTSRTTRNNALLEHEFITLREVDGVLAYQAQPSGQPAAEFRSTRITDSTVTFENRQHDFPQLIGYRRGAGDSLQAWIEGPGRSGPRRVNFAYRRVACER